MENYETYLSTNALVKYNSRIIVGVNRGIMINLFYNLFIRKSWQKIEILTEISGGTKSGDPNLPADFVDLLVTLSVLAIC